MKQQKQIYLVIIIVSLIVIGTSVYYVLGGFDEIEVFEFEGSDRTVIGKHYIGKFRNHEVRDFIMETRTMIDSGRLQGQLALVHYQNDTIGSDSSHLYIGASIDEIRNILAIPSGYTYEEFRTRKIYRTFITQHPLVRPLPADVRTLMEVQAIENGEVLQPYTFDLYYEDGSWCTEGWIR